MLKWIGFNGFNTHTNSNIFVISNLVKLENRCTVSFSLQWVFSGLTLNCRFIYANVNIVLHSLLELVFCFLFARFDENNLFKSLGFGHGMLQPSQSR